MRRSLSKVNPILYEKGKIMLLDQSLLPFKKKYLELKSYKEVVDAIKDMKVRGAPLIGITSAYGMALAANEYKNLEAHKLINKMKVIGEEIKESRPTAVNLRWAVDLILNSIFELISVKEIVEAVEKRAIWIHEDDALRCQKIGEYGTEILRKIASNKKHMDTNILTICNTGSLATGGIGTAFGVILTAFKSGLNIKVVASETRPRQQGARLTTFECIENGIKCTLVSDTACGYLMKKGEIDLVITGADRIANNGDTANKIGTYQLAVLAKEHNIPFYVAAPLSTFDLSMDCGEVIPIEERDIKEVKEINGKPICVSGVSVLNPAFDITPSRYITGIITEKGVLNRNYAKEIKGLFSEVAVV